MVAVVCTAVSVPGTCLAAFYGAAWVFIADPLLLHITSAILAAAGQAWCAVLINVGVAVYYYKDTASCVTPDRPASPEIMSFV
jgi:hypothetical protein